MNGGLYLKSAEPHGNSYNALNNKEMMSERCRQKKGLTDPRGR